jgi:uncharacterized alkaline shock family protein YloU
MSGPILVISQPVMRDVLRRAVLEVPGVVRVGRGGSAWRRALGGSAVSVRVRHDAVDVRLVIVARPGQALPTVAAEVRSAASAAIERLLGLRVGAVSVLVDGVGA